MEVVAAIWVSTALTREMSIAIAAPAPDVFQTVAARALQRGNAGRRRSGTAAWAPGSGLTTTMVAHTRSRESGTVLRVRESGTVVRARGSGGSGSGSGMAVRGSRRSGRGRGGAAVLGGGGGSGSGSGSDEAVPGSERGAAARKADHARRRDMAARAHEILYVYMASSCPA